MDGEIKIGTTVAGKINYTVTIGKTTYIRVKWNDILEIMKYREKDLPSFNVGYSKDIYSGD